MSTVTAAPPHVASRDEFKAARLTFTDAMAELSREERFMATVYAMNSLMIAKGYYTAQEAESYYCQWAEAQVKKPRNQRIGLRSKILSWFS